MLLMAELGYWFAPNSVLNLLLRRLSVKLSSFDITDFSASNIFSINLSRTINK